MNDSIITLRGYVGGDPKMRLVGTQQTPVTNFRVGCTPRRLNRQTGEWVDTETQWYTVNAWRKLAENVNGSIRKGDPVLVQGRLLARTYVNNLGVEVSTFEVEADAVGHDLNRGTTTVAKNRWPLPVQGQPQQQAGPDETGGDPLSGWRTDQSAEIEVWDTPGDPSRQDPWEQSEPDQTAAKPVAEVDAA